ncbi:MAG: PilZ domain-containing protein [Tepidisphaerales bacterium]
MRLHKSESDDRERRGRSGAGGGEAGATRPMTALEWFRGVERRAHRRHDLHDREIMVERLDDARRRVGKLRPLGQLVDLSAGGLRLRTKDKSVAQVGKQIRIRLELPPFAGISPFVDHSGSKLRPKREWVGWLTVVRVRDLGDEVEIGAKLEDIDELDRGMLSLYLSTQPLAA